jgi:hypothetical protein
MKMESGKKEEKNVKILELRRNMGGKIFKIIEVGDKRTNYGGFFWGGGEDPLQT